MNEEGESISSSNQLQERIIFKGEKENINPTLNLEISSNKGKTYSYLLLKCIDCNKVRSMRERC